MIDRIGPFDPHMTRAQDVELEARHVVLAMPPATRLTEAAQARVKVFVEFTDAVRRVAVEVSDLDRHPERRTLAMTGAAADIFERPQHPYTRALLAAEPKPDLQVTLDRYAQWFDLGEISAPVPMWISPGQPDDTITLFMGYGRTRAGKVGTGLGYNAFEVRRSDAMDAGFDGLGRPIQKVRRVSGVHARAGPAAASADQLAGGVACDLACDVDRVRDVVMDSSHYTSALLF